MSGRAAWRSEDGNDGSPAWRRLARLAPALGLGVLLLGSGCGDGDGGEPTGPTDSGLTDLGDPPDSGCGWRPLPNCSENQYLVQDPPVGECTEGPWRCEDCPDWRNFPSCPTGQTHLRDDNGCLSAVLCGCSRTTPPRCPEGQVPQQVCDDRGTCCYTGGCGIDCPPVADPECGVCEEELRDERGCRTGDCRLKACPAVEPPSCPCGERPGRNACGCLTGACQLEPAVCTVTEAPTCPPGKTPELEGNCLTGGCVTGRCATRCAADWDCSSADVCQVYGDGCSACFPKACEDFLDCPNATDCREGRCQLRTEPTCSADAPCAEGLECDLQQCGACEPPCDCVTSADCGDGERCLDCACIPGCKNDGDCQLPRRCHVESGECRGCECEQDDTCPAGEYCNGCFCQPGCRTNDDCPPWEVCTAGPLQACAPEVGCTRPADCREGQRCVDTRCIPEPGRCAAGVEPCEPFFDSCSCDYVCARLHEQPLPCSRECPGAPPSPPLCLCTDEGCIVGRCEGTTGISCPAPYHCSHLDPGRLQDKGVCREGRPPARELCRFDADCAPEVCCEGTIGTRCVQAELTACQTPVSCADEDLLPPITGCRCVDGVCQPTP